MNDPLPPASLLPWTAGFDALLRSVPKPLWLVSARDGVRMGGLLATQVWPTSIDPAEPVFLVGLATTHHTAELVRRSGKLAVQPLRKSQAEAALPFGSTSGRDVDKWKQIPSAGRTPGGLPLLTPASAWAELAVVRRFEGGPRQYFLAEAVAGAAPAPSAAFGDAADADPLLTDAALIQAALPEQRAELKRRILADAAAQGEAWRAWKGTEV